MTKKNNKNIIKFFICELLFIFLLLPIQTKAVDPDCAELDVSLSAGSALDSLGNAIAGNQNTSDVTKEIICRPQPRIQIPGLTFSDPNDLASTKDAQGNVYVPIPFLGQYMAAIYKYSIAIMGILCIIFLIVSGIEWTLYGANPDNVESAKKRIMNSFTGLIIALSSYIILWTIDPKLVEFKSLNVQIIKKIDYGELAGQMLRRGTDGDTIFIPTSDPNDHRATPGPDQPLSEEVAIALIKNTSLNPCTALGTFKTESTRVHGIGQDENVRRCSISSRRAFLASGVKYSGATFAVTNGNDPNSYRNVDCDRNNFRNDAIFDITNPPDYGLDWRFSKGIGLGQYTIFPNFAYPDEAHTRDNARIPGPNGLEWARNNSTAGRWYTVTDLLNPDLAFESTLALMVRCDRRFRESGNNAIAFRNCYGGGDDPLDPREWSPEEIRESRFMPNYCQCITEHGNEFGLSPDPICNYFPAN